MAFTNGASHGSSNSKTSGSNYAHTIATNSAPSSANTPYVLVCIIAADNVSTTDGETTLVSSVTDSKSNTWKKAIEFTNGQGTAATGATVAIYYSVITSQLVVSTDTVTVNFSSSIAAKAVSLYGWQIASGKTVEVDGTGTLANDGADPGALSATGGQNVEHVWIRATASESNSTSHTRTSGWDTTFVDSVSSGSTAATNMGIRGETKIATGTSSGTSDPTVASADHASALAGLIEVSESRSGTIGVTAAKSTGSLSGSVINPITGTLSLNAATVSSSVTGNVINPITGTISLNTASSTTSISATETFSGSLGVTASNVTADFVGSSGSTSITGAMAVTANSATVTASGAATDTNPMSALGGYVIPTVSKKPKKQKAKKQVKPSTSEEITPKRIVQAAKDNQLEQIHHELSKLNRDLEIQLLQAAVTLIGEAERLQAEEAAQEEAQRKEAQAEAERLEAIEQAERARQEILALIERIERDEKRQEYEDVIELLEVIDAVGF